MTNAALLCERCENVGIAYGHDVYVEKYVVGLLLRNEFL